MEVWQPISGDIEDDDTPNSKKEDIANPDDKCQACGNHRGNYKQDRNWEHSFNIMHVAVGMDHYSTPSGNQINVQCHGMRPR